MEKTLLLGLDACSWDVLDRAEEEGAIPTISSHVERGFTAGLESTIPAKTVPAWKAMTSGKNPGRLGVFTGRIGAWGGEKRVPLQYDFPAADFWDYLNEYADLSTAILNGTNTYPPRRLDGVMVSRRIVSGHDLYVYPPGEADRLDETGYLTYRSFRSTILDTPDPDLSAIRDYLERQYRTAREYLNDNDLVFLTTMLTDQFEHEYLDGDPVVELYGIVDGLLEEIEAEHPDLNVVIVSDHGMTRGPDHVVWINQWLKERGYLVETSAEGGTKQLLRKTILRTWDRLPKPVQSAIMGAMGLANVQETASSLARDYDIDWDASSAAYWVGGIRLGEPSESLASEIVERFEEDFGHLYPETCTPLLEARDVYEGEFVEEAPDLVVNPYLHRHLRIRQKACNDVLTDASDVRWKHEHDPIGVFIADGPLYSGGTQRERASIYDVMPTLLASYGLRVDGAFDGAVASSAVPDDAVETVDELPPPSASDYVGDDITIEEHTRDVERHLEELGYLG